MAIETATKEAGAHDKLEWAAFEIPVLSLEFGYSILVRSFHTAD